MNHLNPLEEKILTSITTSHGHTSAQAYKALMEGARTRQVMEMFEKQRIQQSEFVQGSVEQLSGEPASATCNTTEGIQGAVSGVIEAILSERAYQDSKYPVQPRNLNEWFAIMSAYLGKAELSYVRKGRDEALHELRKAVAVGFAALEAYGAPRRGEKCR